MSKYVIIHGQFHEVSDDELMHWKYIKREKVNGKWVYTYDKPETKKLQNTKKSDWKTKVSNFLNSTKQKSEQNRAERKQDWAESKERGTQKAAKEATKYDGGIVIKSDGSGARKIKSTFKDTDSWLNGTTTIDTGSTEVRETRRGKISRFVDTAKEYIKDRLGYDERELAKSREENVRRAEVTLKRREQEARQAEEQYKKVERELNESGFGTKAGVEAALAEYNAKQALEQYDREIQKKWDELEDDKKEYLLGPDSLRDAKKYSELILEVARTEAASALLLGRNKKAVDDATANKEKAYDRFDEANKVYSRAGEMYVDAYRDYLDTPIGRLENTYESAEEWFEKVFGKKR